MENEKTYGVWAVRNGTSMFGYAEAWCKENVEFRDQLIDGANRTLTGFKQKGILSVYKIIDFLGIKNRLLGVKRHLHQSMETADSGIASLGHIGDEMYGVRTHLGNIKRELTGKEPTFYLNYY
jgi:hypothetical protein